MKLNRVKEILNSPENIEVLYDSHPVWINGVDEKTNRVMVKILDNKQKVYVPVEDLVDTGKVISIER